MSSFDNTVAVSFTGLDAYPQEPPYHPGEAYPELDCPVTAPRNEVFASVRDMLRQLDLDRERFCSPEWNPLGEFIRPGMMVLVKPNAVRHFHVKGRNVLSVITHASVVRPVIDYVLKALDGEGKVLLADSQVVFGDFDAAMAASGIQSLLDWYRTHVAVAIECFDLRMVRAVSTWAGGRWGRQKVEHDPRGYRWVDLGSESYFRDHDPMKLRIGVASHREMYPHHSGGKHEYLFPQSVLDCDAIVSIPKLKTHRRGVVSLSIKSFIGLPAGKDSLPHYTIGSPQEGGDQYIHPSWRKRLHTRLHDAVQSSSLVVSKLFFAVLKKMVWGTHIVVPFKDTVNEAMWPGNDTVWRTLLDLVRVALYADCEGRLCETVQRVHFCVVDGIIGGEKDGPVAPDVVKPGVLLAGFNPAAVDAVAATLMGFDIEQIPQIRNALSDVRSVRPLFRGRRPDIAVLDEGVRLSLSRFASRRNLRFAPHSNWDERLQRR